MMGLEKKRGVLQISFAWLFGIIAGAVILALAIFFASKFIHIGQYQTSAEAQKQISVLLNPLESGVQSGQVTTLSMSSPTRIYNICNNQSGVFGEQTLSISQQSFGKWSVAAEGTSIQDRYIFSNNVTEGKEFLLFSKPLDFPFKIADLIYMSPSSTNYCFVNPPNGVYTELSNLKQSNILLKDSISQCPTSSVSVCFTGSVFSCGGANITVNYEGGTVEKNSTKMYFNGDALMYAAIFSDKPIYNCQLQRLMGREAELSGLYQDKASIIQSQGCNIGFLPDLSSLENQAKGFKSEDDLGAIAQISNKLQQENQLSQCQLW